MIDQSNGYEAIARHFVGARTPSIGPSTVQGWAKRLPTGASVLELGCGFGLITQVLVDAGFEVYAIDASPTLLAMCRERFPNIPTACEAAEESDFFGRTFDAVVAWGLLFLLPEDTQRAFIPKMAAALKPGGRLLFTSERDPLAWNDSLTDQRSVALGFNEYVRLLEKGGLQMDGTDQDVGGNFYYFARKPQSPSSR